MDDTISLKAALDICDHAIDLLKGQFGAGALVAIRESIAELPPAQPAIVPCDYAKACNEVAMNRITSAVVYMEILKDFKEYGYVLVDMREVTT